MAKARLGCVTCPQPLCFRANLEKILILGLDGATFDLIKPWVEAGYLPTFAKLLREGACAPLRSVPNMNTAPAWTTFMTGKNPGKHGVYWFAEEGDTTGTVRFVNAADRKAQSIWNLLSSGGRTVAAINVPLTFPAEQVNGLMLAGFDAPSTASEGFSYPPGLIEDVEKQCGRYILHAAVSHHAVAGRMDKVVEGALAAEQSRVDAALHLLRTQPWDVFMYMIKATDQVAHHVWDVSAEEQMWMKPVYEFADKTLAKFMEEVGPDCGVIVMSDHGMGWRQPAAEFVGQILTQLGFQARAESKKGGMIWRAFRLAKRLGAPARGLLKSALPTTYRKFAYKVRFGGIDWSRTRAYSDNTRSCLWVNLVGRNPQGVVKPEEYGELIDDLKELLTGLVDSDTGEHVVNAAWTPEDIYSGPHTGSAPDIQIDWRYDRPIRGVSYKGRLGEAESKSASQGFMHHLTGAHRRHGVLMMWGPQFAAGSIDAPGLEDLAPTILHLAGLPVSQDMDGRVLLEALSSSYSKVAVVRSGADENLPDIDPVVYSEEEEAVIEDRLRSLGYL